MTPAKRLKKRRALTPGVPALAAAVCLFIASCASPGPHSTAEALPSAPLQQIDPTPSGGSETADPPGGPLEITVEKAIVIALQNNLALKVESFNPAIVQTAEEEARAAFDPSFSAIYARSRDCLLYTSPSPRDS